MGFGGVLPPRKPGGARALPQPRDAEEQLHPVAAEGGYGSRPSGRMLRHLPERGSQPGSSALNHFFFYLWTNLVLWSAFAGRNAVV